MRPPRRAPAYLHGSLAWGPTPTRDASAPQGSRISSRFTGVGPHPHARCARPAGLPHILTVYWRGAPPPRAMRSPRRAPAYLHGLLAWGPTPTRDALARRAPAYLHDYSTLVSSLSIRAQVAA